MDFREFTNRLEQDLKVTLAATAPGSRVSQGHVDKMQGQSYEAIQVMPPDSNVAMSINANQLYGMLQDTGDYDAVLKQAMDMAKSGLDQMPAVDVADLTDYSKAKQLLCVEVVGTEANQDMLSKVPHQEMEDMSMIYRLQLSESERGTSSVLVNHELLKQFGVSQEQLHQDALENSEKLRPPVMKTMAAVMAEMMGMPEDAMADMAPPLYVVTNESKVNGAAVMFYPDFMDQAAKQMESSFFILPSSVHEMLILPDEGANLSDLKAMVMSVNETEVSPEDKLTDQVYHYDAEARTFELGEKFEARQAERQAEMKAEKAAAKAEAKEGRSSVLKDLQDKKQDAELKPRTPSHHKSKSDPALA